MPSFANPFVANVPRTMTKGELVQAIRVDLASELEAALLYEAHAATTDDEVARKVLLDIANEEKEHMGELLALLEYLDPSEADHFAEGVGEVKDMMDELGVQSSAAQDILGSVVSKDADASQG
ncbi:demethoxyubiquinone hydroxylase family protein [Gordonibacter sp.]|uniref:demethoxyubiquinone hydroxylase family protein n=1 Tax=Gordonibacter sp. TaxID=1968902 RepID=UPI0025BA1333|nr:demethoxyubiquinone hydroxylase family protein [Gordonibacter sp.]